MKNRNISELIYLSLHASALTIVFFYIISSNQFVGELSQFNTFLPPPDILFVYLLSLAGFIVAYFAYTYSKNIKLYTRYTPLRLNPNRLLSIFLILTTSQIVFIVTTDVGRIGSNATSTYSPYMSLLNPDALFGIFYLLLRDNISTKKIYFWSGVALYLSLKLLQGWTGVILLIFFIELHHYYKNKNVTALKRLALVLFAPFFLILAGGSLYYYIFPYKFEIRGLGFEEITYVEGVTNLTNRLTFFPIALGAYEERKELIDRAHADETIFRESKGFLRPILPRSIMQDKEFRSINNLIMQVYYPNIELSTSSDMGLPLYLTSVFSADPLDGVLIVMLSTILILLNKFAIDSFEQYRGQLNFLYFLLIMKFYYIASPEVVFGFGFMGLFSLVPILLLTSSFKIKNSFLRRD